MRQWFRQQSGQTVGQTGLQGVRGLSVRGQGGRQKPEEGVVSESWDRSAGRHGRLAGPVSPEEDQGRAGGQRYVYTAGVYVIDHVTKTCKWLSNQ